MIRIVLEWLMLAVLDRTDRPSDWLFPAVCVLALPLIAIGVIIAICVL